MSLLIIIGEKRSTIYDKYHSTTASLLLLFKLMAEIETPAEKRLIFEKGEITDIKNYYHRALHD